MRDHKMRNPDGTERGIPCDKVKIGQLIWTMLQSKLSFMLGDDQIAEYRLWLALVPRFIQGLPDSGAALKTSRSLKRGATEVEDAVKDFLATYHFKTVNDEEGRGESGLTPLMYAVMVGNAEIATELIDQGSNGCALQAAQIQYDDRYGYLDDCVASCGGAVSCASRGDGHCALVCWCGRKRAIKGWCYAIDGRRGLAQRARS